MKRDAVQAVRSGFWTLAALVVIFIALAIGIIAAALAIWSMSRW